MPSSIKEQKQLKEKAGDRASYELEKDQVALIEKCAELNPNTAVMLVSGGGMRMEPWIDKVKAVMWLFSLIT